MAEVGSKPRILMIGPLAPPVGGMATVVENLVRALTADCDVRVLNNVKRTAPDRSLVQAVTAQLRLLGQLAWACLAWRPAVVHIHTCSWLTFWRSAADVVLARALGRRVVLHVHGGEFDLFLASLSARRALLARAVFRSVHRIVVLGKDWKQLLDGWADPTRVVVVPNGVPVPELREPRADGVFTVVCLADYQRRKGQEDLLAAVAALGDMPPVRLALLGGDVEAGWRAHLLEKARTLGIGDRVEIPGPVMGAAKDGWWATADAFCLPSYVEGLPMSMLEAMARGLPVVVTGVGSVPDAVLDGEEGLLYAPGDVDRLTEHLRSLVADSQRARALGRAGHARVVREFSLTRSAAQVLALYRELCAGAS